MNGNCLNVENFSQKKLENKKKTKKKRQPRKKKEKETFKVVFFIILFVNVSLQNQYNLTIKMYKKLKKNSLTFKLFLKLKI